MHQVTGFQLVCQLNKEIAGNIIFHCNVSHSRRYEDGALHASARCWSSLLSRSLNRKSTFP